MDPRDRAGRRQRPGGQRERLAGVACIPPHEALRKNVITHMPKACSASAKAPGKLIEGKPAPGPAGKKKAAEFPPQLYNLTEDPGETKDLAAVHPDVLKRLAARLDIQRHRGRQ